MDFTTVFAQMGVLAFIIVLGFVARKVGIMGDPFDGALTRLVLDVTLPCMVLGSVFTAHEAVAPDSVVAICGFSFAAYAIAAAIGLTVAGALRAPRDSRGSFAFMVTFGNCGFMGFPVVAAVYGSHAVLYAAIANIAANVLMFTVGVAMVSASGGHNALESVRKSAKHLFTPTIIACVLAMVLAMAGVHDAGLAGQAFATVGQMTTPASLLIIGSSLARYSPREVLGSWRPYVASAARLFVVPLAVLFALRPFISDPLVIGVIVLIASMPAATNGLMFCLRYNGNLKVMTQGIFISTAASIVTIPLMAMVISSLI